MKEHIFTTAIIAAAGSGSRMKSDISKQFILIDGIPVLAKTLLAFDKADEIDEIIVVTRESDISEVKTLSEQYKISKPTSVIKGGATRQQSVYNGLLQAKGELVLIHDGARPFITPAQIASVAVSLHENDAAALGIPVTDTLKSANSDKIITGTVDRSGLYSIQTPQGFKKNLIKSAHEKALIDGIEVTDDCALCEACGIDVKIIDGSSTNIKITSPDDLKVAAGINSQNKEKTKMRVGLGYDVHKLVEGRALILGGVKIPHTLGLLGHSDADVLLHAIMDAMLGAAALGDIGKHFPDTDERWRGADSTKLLSAVNDILKENSARVVNIDSTIIAQKPKLAPYIPQMRRIISEVLQIPEHTISVKATTTERLGFCGREEGIAAEAICGIEMVF